jgi:hypothetical protein
VPALKPTIPRNPATTLRKMMEKLRTEDRPVTHFKHHEMSIWLIPSSGCAVGTDLKKMWEELQEAETTTNRSFVFTSW